jgi:hypothetical protein
VKERGSGGDVDIGSSGEVRGAGAEVGVASVLVLVLVVVIDVVVVVAVVVAVAVVVEAELTEETVDWGPEEGKSSSPSTFLPFKNSSTSFSVIAVDNDTILWSPLNPKLYSTS